jgi:hypothetical protein
MKKKVSIIILFILVFTVIIFFFMDKKPITVNKQMLMEENHMESAWDFNQNLNIGWNLGMSLSANIKYSEIITYNVIVNNKKFKDFKSKETNSFFIENEIANSFNIEFNIPYSNLDGILYWNLDEVSIDKNVIFCDKSYETKVVCGKAFIELENIDIIGYHEIEIKITIKNFYEYNTKNKVDFYETFWCETKTDKELIQTLKNKGFNAIRISFDVSNHLNKEGIIDSLWLDRLKEIVDYCVDLDVYCLIDIVETYGLFADKLNDSILNKFKSLWIQVATLFKDYDDKLIFSPFNELRNSSGEWIISNDIFLENMNHLYQIFVDTIRSTGGNNQWRNLMLTTYAAGVNDDILNDFKIPNDSTFNHLLVECHVYHPVNFTFNEINLGSTDFVYEWGSKKDKNSLNDIFYMISDFMKKTKLPVIIGEFGVADRNNISEMNEYYRYYKKQTNKLKIGILVFDDSHDFVIIDRKTKDFINEDIINTLTK